MTTLEELKEIYNLPLTTLILRAQEVHHRYQDPSGVQLCTLKSIKTGKCSEDCKYCPQSAHNDTGIEPEKLLDTDRVMIDARMAKADGATRFCMGAAWRKVYTDSQFQNILETVSAVKALDLEVCCTLGMLDVNQAQRLKEAGCDVYNHNIDSSREFYSKIITTRTFDDRLNTIKNVREAGMEVCCGGILGMGESVEDRLNMLLELANMDPPPDSVPINALVAVKGTPLEDQPFVDSIEFVRTIATARIAMPYSIVRLSAGRSQMSDEMHALCYLAGANSIFLGDRLLVTENPRQHEDRKLLDKLGLHDMHPDSAREIHARAKADMAEDEACKAVKAEAASAEPALS
ncbi:biotin synthase BioB [Ruficoccus sp. ZRK36]|nr:biotin synthase BioB [Ruficoccus sp. ZRK36]QYY34672.1 biotin synthase BioB [Ruficoccus sp. ZRK36]